MLIIILSAAFIYIVRINTLNKQKLVLEKTVSERTEDLVAANEELKYANELLEEHSQTIEKQSEELMAQKEELVTQKEELIKTNFDLKELNRTKDKFLSIIAHDIKSPFQAVLGVSDILSNNVNMLSDEERTLYSKTIYDSSVSIYNLLENLLEWSRAQTKSIQYHPIQFFLNEIINNNHLLLNENLLNKKINLIIENKENLEVYADRDMIDTVLRNLLSNAIKFTGINGKIFLSCFRKDGDVVVCVKDTGLGMKLEHINKLFKIDENVTSEGTNGERGTGLGLLICKEFVELHSGKIWVESELGKGSSFYFTIPNLSE